MHIMTPEEKAYLVSIGSASIDEALGANLIPTTATAGPGAGGSSVFIRSGGRRVRLSTNPASPLRVVPDGDGVAVVHDKETITRGSIERPLCHCPEQAYITVSERCVHDCTFCPVPKLDGAIKNTKTVARMVEEANAGGSLSAISLTSGVAESPEREVERVAAVVRALRARFDLPIGVSVYPTAASTAILRAAGADEVKYNVETMDPGVFRAVCPGLSLPFILDALAGAVEVFGRNAVFSNFIIGLGEEDSMVRDGVAYLAELGVIPILRPISASPLRAGEIAVERPSAERLLGLAAMTRDILEQNGLDPRRARTMCLPCTGCDLTPFRDV
ncbi:MAG: radical SAM protein [Methanoculleus sp.]|uniref:radical SAM protein n=1 Tax=unclassified Methanoculleus TaxID=2619537 RepID=UPI0025EFE72A|nr:MULTISPECIES: radical SAM protein [unclassified Methanoculleus]MCK9317810.1 radical SAM protein [Methanoculleus sp.]MDD2255099.1 radical SAM protein [Methanoculleus sp.]MDD3217287.1 radical SAM protein [Methanoculleus sp.]MDD4315395.1 radical SAM protein [Methanoculleus sp.]MDD4472014.1 radical SAM protein [Methanoculleus sp.]